MLSVSVCLSAGSNHSLSSTIELKVDSPHCPTDTCAHRLVRPSRSAPRRRTASSPPGRRRGGRLPGGVSGPTLFSYCSARRSRWTGRCDGGVSKEAAGDGLWLMAEPVDELLLACTVCTGRLSAKSRALLIAACVYPSQLTRWADVSRCVAEWMRLSLPIPQTSTSSRAFGVIADIPRNPLHVTSLPPVTHHPRCLTATSEGHNNNKPLSKCQRQGRWPSRPRSPRSSRGVLLRESAFILHLSMNTSCDSLPHSASLPAARRRGSLTSGRPS